MIAVPDDTEINLVFLAMVDSPIRKPYAARLMIGSNS